MAVLVARPRRRASLVSILMASAVLPIALNFGRRVRAPTGLRVLPFSFAITMAGTMGGMLLANQFAFDGSAYAAHLLSQVPGRIELRARAAAIARGRGPGAVRGRDRGQRADRPGRPTAGRIRHAGGELRRRHRAGRAAVGARAVPAAGELQPVRAQQGGGSAKGLLALVAMIGTLLLCVPVVDRGVPVLGVGRRARGWSR